MSEGSRSRAQGPEGAVDREPWMRGTHGALDAVRRAVVHALELAEEDVDRWCGRLSDAEMSARPAGLEPVAFHLRHVVRSLDRLLTYAELRDVFSSESGVDELRVLSVAQLEALATEMAEGTAATVMAEFREGLRNAKERVRAFSPESLAEARGVGRKRLPTTVAGLLIHCAEHTSRHVGQAVTTVKVVKAVPEERRA